jgi:hypothetical protein
VKERRFPSERPIRTGSLARPLVALVLLLAIIPSSFAGGSAGGPRFVPNGGIDSMAGAGNTVYLTGQFSSFAARSGNVAVIDQAGHVDPSGPVIEGDIHAILPDGAGGFFVGGDFNTVGTVDCPNLAHVRADYSLDSGWCPTPDGSIRSLARSGGTLYAGGDFTSVGGDSLRALAALDARTGTVLPWDAGLSGGLLGAGPVVRALAVTGGTVLAGGYFAVAGGLPRRGLVALEAASGKATGWNPCVGACVGGVGAIVVDGRRAIVAGSFRRTPGHGVQRLTAIDLATGRVSEPFARPDGAVDALALARGELYAGGEFDTIGGTKVAGLVAFDVKTGGLLHWRPDLGGSRADVSALAISGSIAYALGDFESVGGKPRQGLAAIDIRSGRATGWNPNPDSVTYGFGAITRVGAHIVVGGTFGAFGTPVRRDGFAAINGSTGELTGWQPQLGGNANLALGGCEGAVAAAGSTVFLAGAFSSVDGRSRAGLAAVDGRTGTILGWNPVSKPAGWSCVYPHLLPAGPVVYLAGTFKSIDGQTRPGLAAVDATTGHVTAWNPAPQPSEYIRTLATANNVVYVGGSFARIGGSSRFDLAALDTTTGHATPWDPEPNGDVYAITAAGDTIYVAGTFTSIGGAKRNGIAAINVLTGKATAWNPVLYPPDVGNITVAGNAVIISGGFTYVDGIARSGLAVLDAATGKPLPWDPESVVGGVISGLTVVGTTLYLGGYFNGNLTAFPLSDVTHHG